MLEGIGYDLRLGFRGLRRDRAFTVTAIATLALAIGLNVTAFAVMNAMLFRGFPLVKRNDRLLYIQEKAGWLAAAFPARISRSGAPMQDRFRSSATSQASQSH